MRRAAEVIGLSQSAFVRQLVLSKIIVAAWWVAPFYNSAMTVRALRSTAQSRAHEYGPDFYLELLYETQDGGAAYRVFGDSRLPLRARGLAVAKIDARQLCDGRVIFAGDKQALWRITRSVEDANMGDQLLWLLAPDRRADTDPANLPPG